jgi:hypothetical protein
MLNFQTQTDREINTIIHQISRKNCQALMRFAMQINIQPDDIINEALLDLSQETGCVLTRPVITRRLKFAGITAVRKEVGRKGARQYYSLNVLADDNGLTYQDLLVDHHPPPDHQGMRYLTEAIESLPPNGQFCINQLLDGKRFREIGVALGVSTSRVEQMVKGYTRQGGRRVDGIYDRLREWFRDRQLTFADVWGLNQ